jgi:hypothetical protein
MRLLVQVTHFESRLAIRAGTQFPCSSRFNCASGLIVQCLAVVCRSAIVDGRRRGGGRQLRGEGRRTRQQYVLYLYATRFYRLLVTVDVLCGYGKLFREMMAFVEGGRRA